MKRFLIFLSSLVILFAVVYFVEPPHSWKDASLFQILIFFIPVLLCISFLSDLFLKYLPHSFIAGLGGMVILALVGVQQLNYLSGLGVVAATILAIRLFPKTRLPRFRLTRNTKIPKLHRIGEKR